ncbi:MAG: hypothetical protein HZB85_02230 [Deltaproteobacteria bacterium]|nr:hypothetical protein [Deltaproteobacteria bacterium]
MKIPEGLYLYQPSMRFSDFTALFIVKDGKLVDPYLKYAASGRNFVEVMSDEERKLLDGLNKEYASGRAFTVYRGRERAGGLRDVKLKIVRNCYSQKMMSNIIGDGRYTDDPEYSKNAAALYTFNHDFEDFALLKGIAAPSGIKDFIKGKGFVVSEADKVKALEAAKASLFGEAMRRIKNDLRHLHRGVPFDIVSEGEGGLEYLRAIDIDGDGEKDLVGIYIVDVGYRFRDAGAADAYVARDSKEVLFTVLGMGKAEAVAFGEYIQPAFSLGGVIDIDQDGALELVVQVSMAESGGEEGDYEEGRRIEVFMHGKRGWIKVYGTKGICGSFN